MSLSNRNDWTEPKALAIPKEGYFKLEQVIREYGKTLEKALEADPSVLAPLKLHYLRWVLFDIGKDTYFMYQGSRPTFTA